MTLSKAGLASSPPRDRGTNSAASQLMMELIRICLASRQLANAQLLPRLFTDHAGIPGRIPDKIHSGVADAF
jgi:hypothetical protein